MNNISAYLSIWLLLFSFIFATSGKGQIKTTGRQLNSLETNPGQIESPENKNQAVDPLFFIEGQLCQHVRKIYQDKKGNLWFGTNIYGLMHYDGDTLVYFSESDGLGGGRITAIVEDAAGNLWFGTYGGLTKYDGITFTNFTEKEGLLENEIWSLLIDSHGQFWIGTNAGVCCFDGKSFNAFPIPKARIKDTTTIYSYDRITDIVEDSKGNTWFGTDGFGICKYDGQSFTNMTAENGLPDNTISQLMADTKGNIWIGTYFGGLSMYNGKKFINYTREGLVKGVEVSGFFEDKKGDIWFAVENNGVYFYNAGLDNEVEKGKLFTHLYKEEGLQTNGILCIFEDKEGRFWMGGWGGLFRFDGKAFFSVTKDGPWQ